MERSSISLSSPSFERWLPRLLVVLCCLQPVLDALSYWQDALSLSSSITLIPRTLLLALMAVLGLVLCTRKKLYILFFGVIGCFWLCHCLVCLQNGYETWFTDTSNFLRVLQLPVTTICLIACLRRCGSCFDALQRGLFYTFGVIVLLQLLALLTGTEPYTYPDKMIGLRGWCFWPNAQSAILSLLAPVCMSYAFVHNRSKHWIGCGISVLCLGFLFLHGTRLAYLCMLIAGVGMAITLAILKFSKKNVAFVLLITVVLGACYPVSPMVRNQKMVADNAQRKAQVFEDLVAIGEEEAQGLEGKEYEIARLRLGYTYYCSELVDRFGIEAVLEAYDYTEDVSTIINERTWKLKFCQLLMEESTQGSRLFGLSVGRMIHNGLSHDPENDFHGIYYLYGLVGLGLLLLFLGYFLWLIAKAMFTAPKRYFTMEAAGCVIALITLLIHSFFTCGVLRRANTLFYFGAILAMIYYLVQCKHYPDQQN